MTKSTQNYPACELNLQSVDEANPRNRRETQEMSSILNQIRTVTIPRAVLLSCCTSIPINEDIRIGRNSEDSISPL